MMDENAPYAMRRESDKTDEASEVNEQDSAHGQFGQLSHQLRTDGSQWRAQLTTVVEETAQRLRLQLDTQFSEFMARKGEVGIEGVGAVNQKVVDTPLSQLAARRRTRYLVVAVATIMLVAVFGAVLALNRNNVRQIVPPPRLLTWNYEAAFESKTPQKAFAAAATLTPCNDAPAQMASETWLDAGPNYGLALINVTCPPSTQSYAIWLFSLGRDDQHHWVPQAGYTSSWPQSGSTPPSM